MSFSTPANQIPRWSVTGMEGMFTKMWDPPTESPATPDLITATNPVPEVMAAAGLASAPVAPHTMQLELLHGLSIPTWDGQKSINFFTFVNPDVPLASNGSYPGTTIRLPVGAIFHCQTSGKGPPPHTIHWHGIEPTPMNDGVGHCSMEIGQYTYQWQPCFIGTYFYHCHRNTMQHFEFGLFGLLIFEPADAYFATLVDPAIPPGHCRDGKRRTGANLQAFPQFPGWEGGDRTDPDPWNGNSALKMQNLNPQLGNINPHAMTVPYDVEAIWVLDDRDSNWSDLASNARATFPKQGNVPGYNDNFHSNAGGGVNTTTDFFAFNDYRADYWFVTGVPIPAHIGGNAAIPAGIVIDPELNSGISGSQVSIEGYVGQTILVRALDAAYNNVTYTFPMDVVIIEWDGRPLGVPPYGFNEAYLVPAGTEIETSVGRRFGALIREFTPVNTFATCKFIDTRGAKSSFEQVTCTVQIPINISALTVTATTDKASPQQAGTPITVSADMTGTPGSQAPTSGQYEYRFWVNSGSGFTVVQDYSTSSTFVWTPATTGAYDILADVRSIGSTSVRDAFTKIFFYQITAPGPATGVTVAPDVASPQPVGTPITFTATGQGGSGNYEFQFWINTGTGFAIAQSYGASNTFIYTPAAVGPFDVLVDVRNAGSTADREALTKLFFYQIIAAPAAGVTLNPDLASPQAPNTTITFTAQGQGGSGTYEYRFWVNSGLGFEIVQDYSASSTFPWTPIAAGAYDVLVDVRNAGSTAFREALTKLFFYQIQ